MNKIVKVQFGTTEISAGSENEIVLAGTLEVPGMELIAVKRDQHGHDMQTMILGPGCVITYQEAQS